MLIRNDHLYRPEAIAFQRRRLAGEVRVNPTRPLWVSAIFFITVAVAGLTLLFGLNIRVPLEGRCATISDDRILVLSGSALEMNVRSTPIVWVRRGPSPAQSRRVASLQRNPDETTTVVLADGLAPTAARDCAIGGDVVVSPLKSALSRIGASR